MPAFIKKILKSDFSGVRYKYISILLLFLTPGCIAGKCDHVIKSTSTYSDTNEIAYVIDVGCGATVGFVSWIAVTPAEKELDANEHRIAVLEGKVYRIEWKSATELLVWGDAEVFSVEDNNYSLVLNPKN